MNWTLPETPLVSYNIKVYPRSGTTVSIIDSTRANLTLAYNISYNVTIVGDCGQINTTTLIKFIYGNVNTSNLNQSQVVAVA